MGTSFTEEVTPELEILLVERIDVCAGVWCAGGQSRQKDWYVQRDRGIVSYNKRDFKSHVGTK